MADMGVCCWCRSTLLIAAIAGGAQAAPGKPSVAFFYGKQVPVAELSQFDWVVVQPENLDAASLAKLQRAGVEVFAYLSAGEGSPGAVEPAWVLGSNTAWSSAIMNPGAAGWRNQVLDRADALWKDGYRALFLDTLDSYLAVLPGAEARRTAAAALASIVRAIHQRHPKVKLFFNRGFEILDDVGSLAAGLAAESLLHGWDAAAKRYVEVNETDRKWLLGQLQKVKQRFGIPVVVVDYLPPSRRATAREAARRIDAMGFSPWISTPSLDMLGVGTLEVVPRRVLLLYDGAETPSLEQSPIHRLAALPVEYLGCVPTYLDIRAGLPREPLAGLYAGVVTWFTDDEMPDALGYPEWLLRQIEAGVPVAMFGSPGFNASSAFLHRLGIATSAGASRPVRIATRDAFVGLEADPRPRSRGLHPWRASGEGMAVHVRLADGNGELIDPVLTAPWGGMALDPYVLEIGYQGRTRWIVDPFQFLKKALALRPAPALDLTTENGARLLVVVADGVGFASPAGPSAAPAGDVIRRELLARLAVPATVSIPPEELAAWRRNAAALVARVRRPRSGVPVRLDRAAARRHLAIPRPRQAAHRAHPRFPRLARPRRITRCREHHRRRRLAVRELRPRAGSCARARFGAAARSVPVLGQRSPRALVRAGPHGLHTPPRPRARALRRRRTIALHVDDRGQEGPPGGCGRASRLLTSRRGQRRRAARLRGTLSMQRRPKQRGRRRVAGPALTAAVVVVSIGSLGGLHLWAGEADSAPGPADALGLALLRADLELNPG